MWRGRTACRVFTLDDGWGWIFAAVEHWNAECVGWHVCKVGSRFAALDPIAQGLERLWLAGRRIRPRAGASDGGSQYLSDHFRASEIRYWGIHPSFRTLSEEPETNGVAERWNLTLKEQAIHGRIFAEPRGRRGAVADFVERYNQTWRLEKLGYAHADRGCARSMSYARRHSTNMCLGTRRCWYTSSSRRSGNSVWNACASMSIRSAACRSKSAFACGGTRSHVVVASTRANPCMTCSEAQRGPDDRGMPHMNNQKVYRRSSPARPGNRGPRRASSAVR